MEGKTGASQLKGIKNEKYKNVIGMYKKLIIINKTQ